jgi:hypothetical protein
MKVLGLSESSKPNRNADRVLKKVLESTVALKKM